MEKTPILHDPDRLARFRMSIGTRMRGERPMTPVEVALAMRDFMDETGEDVKGMARRLRAHPSTCRMFLSILDLPDDWHDMWCFGRTDAGGHLPVSIAGRLGPKFKGGAISEADMEVLKAAAFDADRPASCDDMTNILSYYNKNPEKTLEECIAAIMNLKPQRITSYVIIADLDIRVMEKAEGDIPLAERIAANALSGRLPAGSLEGLRIKDGKHIQIALTKAGKIRFYEVAKSEGVSANNLTSHLCMKEEQVGGDEA